jgi:hypothetical protein
MAALSMEDLRAAEDGAEVVVPGAAEAIDTRRLVCVMFSNYVLIPFFLPLYLVLYHHGVWTSLMAREGGWFRCFRCLCGWRFCPRMDLDASCYISLVYVGFTRIGKSCDCVFSFVAT